MSFCQGTKQNSLVILLLLWLPICGVISLIIRKKHGIQCMLCSFQIIIEMLPEIHTMEKCDFLKSVIHSQIILSTIFIVFVVSQLIFLYLSLYSG